MRLIDADALSKLVGEPIEVFLRRLDLQLPPTVDAEPVRHGHWIEEIGMFLCSECGDSWGTEMEEMVRSFNFCPNCGAKMQGDNDG